MTTALCTLFEKDYHHGVAALVNSLVRSGYQGTVFAGYRGPLPHWAAEAVATPSDKWQQASTLRVTTACDLVFVPLATKAHFTNIKPDFMLDLFADPALSLDRLLYLDPDICLVKPWQFVADWLTCGVALCEDVNSPLAEHHPRRVGWRRYFGEQGLSLRYRASEYVNGGCVGVSREDLRFLENWRQLTVRMADIIGGLATAKIEGGARFRQSGFASCFDCSDQDVLNAALELTEGVACSILPQAAMAFVPGASVLPHALGPRKPWRRNYLLEALRGMPPTPADKAFWQVVSGPLVSMSATQVLRSRTALQLGSAVARFYRRRE